MSDYARVRTSGQWSADDGAEGGAETRWTLRLMARSSPAGVAAGALFTQFAPHGSKMMGPPSVELLAASQTVLTTEWQIVEHEVEAKPVPNCSAPVSCAKVPLMIWARSPFGTGALIGIDDISVVKVGRETK